MEQEKAFPALDLVKAPSTEAAEKLNEERVQHFELAFKGNGKLKIIAGEKQVTPEAIVLLKKNEEGGWTEVAKVELAEQL